MKLTIEQQQDKFIVRISSAYYSDSGLCTKKDLQRFSHKLIEILDDKNDITVANLNIPVQDR